MKINFYFNCSPTVPNIRWFIIFWFECINIGQCQAREYLYPVACIKRNFGNCIYLMHQISLNKIDLLQWHEESKAITKVGSLPSTISGIKALPDNSGFSFINQGQLFIKLFSKRSPIAISLADKLLYNIEIVEWIDSDHCYFAAKKNDVWEIYVVSVLSGDIQTIAQSEQGDCMYPQIVDSCVYYIERSFTKKSYQVKCIHLNNNKASDKEAFLIIDLKSDPAAFLKMVSPILGFYISYPESLQITKQCDTSVPFEYHQIYWDEKSNCWHNKKLFNFCIPVDMIIGDGKYRLHESLLPFISHYTSRGIYYFDCTDPLSKSKSKESNSKKELCRNLSGTWYEAMPVSIFFYSFNSQQTSLKALAESPRDALGIVFSGNFLYYGTSLIGSSKHKLLLDGMSCDTSGKIHLEVPFLQEPQD